MKNVRFLLFGLLFCSFTGAFSQLTSHISGKIFSSPHQIVYLFRAQDYLSWNRIPVAFGLTDATGNFNLDYAHSDTVKLLMSSRKNIWPILVEPGLHYKLELRPGDPQVYTEKWPGRLNKIIFELEQTCAQLQADILANTGRDTGKGAYEKLYAALEKELAKYIQDKDPYIRSHARYYIGYNMIEAASRLHQYDRMDSLEMALLFGQKVQFQHPEYIQFIYYMCLNRISVPAFRHYCKTPNKDYGQPLDIMKREVLWYPAGPLRGLYMLMAFKISYSNNWYRTKESHTASLISMKKALNDSAQNSISNHILHRYNKITGPFLKEIQVCDKDGKQLNTKSLRDEYTLIQIRLDECGNSARSELSESPNIQKLRVIRIESQARKNSYGPCNSAQNILLHNYLKYDCDTDILIGPNGIVVPY